jgi:hypothetical protein
MRRCNSKILHTSPAANPGTYLTKFLYRPSTRSPLYLITTSQRSGRSCFPANEPSLLMGLITCVTSLDASSTRYTSVTRGVVSLNQPTNQSLEGSCQGSTRGEIALPIDTYAENRILKLSNLVSGCPTKYRHWLWANLSHCSELLGTLYFAETPGITQLSQWILISICSYWVQSPYVSWFCQNKMVSLGRMSATVSCFQ